MQQYLEYFCTDINETGPSLVIFLRVDQFLVLCFLFCPVFVYVMSGEATNKCLFICLFKSLRPGQQFFSNFGMAFWV